MWQWAVICRSTAADCVLNWVTSSSELLSEICVKCLSDTLQKRRLKDIKLYHDYQSSLSINASIALVGYPTFLCLYFYIAIPLDLL